MDIPISQDIRKYKTKDIGNFSFKEAGFIVIGFGLAFITYKLTGDSLELAFLPLIIVLALAFLKPYGMSCIQFLRIFIREKMLPSVFINETDFEYDMDKLEAEYGKEYKIINTDNLTQSASVNNKSKKQINPYEEDLIIR